MKAIHVFGCVCLGFIFINVEARGLEPLYDGLGSYTRKISTKSGEAQKYFDQGINFYFGFNHGAALRAFQAAETIDPDCAMNYWGVALACGGDINFTEVPPAMDELAWKQIQLAREHADHASPVEQGLIEALAQRYTEHEPDDRTSLDQAYADAMRTVWKKYPDDPDVGSLFAESMMDLRPWDQWTPDGKPEPGTDEILAALNKVLEARPEDPFANHLYIHALEASPHPERALAAADRLRDLQPGLSHEVHMPSHIYIRVGRWGDAVTAKLNAVAADRRYRSVFGEPKGLIVLYAAHNHQMLAYAAMMTGQKQLAVQHIREMVRGIPEEEIKEKRDGGGSFVR